MIRVCTGVVVLPPGPGGRGRGRVSLRLSLEPESAGEQCPPGSHVLGGPSPGRG